MSKLDNKKREFERRLNQRRYQQTGSQFPTVDLIPESDLEKRFQDWDSFLSQRLEEFRGDLQDKIGSEPEVATSDESSIPESSERSSPIGFGVRCRPFGRRTPTLEQWLLDLDEMLLDELGLRSYISKINNQIGVRVVDREDEIRQAILDYCPFLNPGDLDELDAHRFGVIHMPGKGTLLNRAHYSQPFNEQPFEETNQEQRAHLISEVAVERWGWGFLQEYTTLGINTGQDGLWPAAFACHLGLPIRDPQAANVVASLQRGSLFLDAGWRDWIWEYVMFKAHRPVGVGLFHRSRPSRVLEAFIKVVDLFPLYIHPFGVRLRLRNLVELIKYLFLEESDLATLTLHSVLMQVQAFCLVHDKRFASLTGSTMSKWLGRLYFAQLESNVGIFAVPYAALIASHVADLLHLAILQEGSGDRSERDVRLYPDTRLALLSKIDSRVKYDPRAMFIAAWERLKLEGPPISFSPR